MAAVSAGVPVSDFWSLTPAELKAYADGYSRRRNHDAWINGIYVQLAFTSVLSAILTPKGKKAIQYPKAPVPDLQHLTEEERREMEEKERLRAIVYFKQMERQWSRVFPTESVPDEVNKDTPP